MGQTKTLDHSCVCPPGRHATVVEPLVRLDTVVAVVGGSIERAQLQYLPLNGRNWATRPRSLPGRPTPGPAINVPSASPDMAWTTMFSVHGWMRRASSIRLKKYVRLAIPIDSISEFEVQSQNFSADIGITAGGQISVASPSGTNAFHGGLFDYFRNNALDARYPFDGASADRSC